MFGTGIALALPLPIYLWFLPLVPLALAAWLVWSSNITFGYWFATSQCLAWALGTASYFALPTLGPGFQYSYLYSDLAQHRVERADGLAVLRATRTCCATAPWAPSNRSRASRSLHVAITLLVALMVQYTLRSRILHIVFWTNFAITVVATLYFGWHYIADDFAGVVIALFSFWLGGLASGQKFDRHGLASHPTSTTSQVPVDAD